MPECTQPSCKAESFSSVGGLSIDKFRQLPESLLQLEAQMQKPRNDTVSGILQSGRLLSSMELNDSAPGATHQKRTGHVRRLSELLSLRVSRGISATGELIEAGQMVTPINDTGDMLRLRAGETHVTSKVKETEWHRMSPWPVLGLIQAYRTRGDSLTQGILIFVLLNVFFCAVTSGMCFIYNARKEALAGQMDDSEDEEPPVRVPRGHHEYHQNNRPIHDSNVSASARQQKPPAVASWNPLTQRGQQPAESQYHSRQSELHSASTRRHLCPELVVPRGSECVLAVRTLVSARLQQVEFDILDVNGKPVLQVEVSPQFTSHSRPWPTQLQRSPTVTLKALHPRESTGHFVLCYCCNVTKEDEGLGSKRNVYIYKDDDELFAHLMKDEARKRYVLTSGRLGLQLLFEGNFEEHAVDVSNESRELLAATEPSVMDFDPTNKYYKLRVAADVDVGLVLSGLLAIDQMEVP